MNVNKAEGRLTGGDPPKEKRGGVYSQLIIMCTIDFDRDTTMCTTRESDYLIRTPSTALSPSRAANKMIFITDQSASHFILLH